jgi:hypothetical protein
MADLTDELAGLNENARLLLEKYDGVFSSLDEKTQQALLDIASKSEEGLNSIQTLLDNGVVAEAENALKLGGMSLEDVLFSPIIFDSGWIDISAGKTYTIEHNLNSLSNIMFMVNYRADADSKIFYNVDSLQSFAHTGKNSDSKFNGIGLEQKDENNVYVITGNDYVFATDNTVQYGGGQYDSGNAQSSGQIKVFAILIEMEK